MGMSQTGCCCGPSCSGDHPICCMRVTLSGGYADGLVFYCVKWAAGDDYVGEVDTCSDVVLGVCNNAHGVLKGMYWNHAYRSYSTLPTSPSICLPGAGLSWKCDPDPENDHPISMSLQLGALRACDPYDQPYPLEFGCNPITGCYGSQKFTATGIDFDWYTGSVVLTDQTYLQRRGLYGIGRYPDPVPTATIVACESPWEISPDPNDVVGIRRKDYRKDSEEGEWYPISCVDYWGDLYCGPSWWYDPVSDMIQLFPPEMQSTNTGSLVFSDVCQFWMGYGVNVPPGTDCSGIDPPYGGDPTCEAREPVYDPGGDFRCSISPLDSGCVPFDGGSWADSLSLEVIQAITRDGSVTSDAISDPPCLLGDRVFTFGDCYAYAKFTLETITDESEPCPPIVDPPPPPPPDPEKYCWKRSLCFQVFVDEVTGCTDAFESSDCYPLNTSVTYTLVWDSFTEQYIMEPKPIPAGRPYTIEAYLVERPDDLPPTAESWERAWFLVVTIRDLFDGSVVEEYTFSYVLDCRNAWSVVESVTVPFTPTEVWRIFVGTSCVDIPPPPECDPLCWPECVLCPTPLAMSLVVTQDPSCCLHGSYGLTYNSGSNWFTLTSAPVGGPSGVCGKITAFKMTCSDSTHVTLAITYEDVNGSTISSTTTVSANCTGGDFETDTVTVISGLFAPGLCEGGLFLGAKFRVVGI